MKRFGWRSSTGDEEQASPPDNSPARSHRSSNSSSRGGSSLQSANTATTKSREQSPARLGADAVGGGGGGEGGGGGGAVVAVSNKKMLKIGANVRFRGDVMECNTVVLRGRLQGFVETRRLTIKEGAQFVGDAKVEEADVSGSLEGSLECTTKVSIRSTGLVSGNVIYNKMSMEDGGELEGTFECSNRASGRLSKEGMAAAAAAAAGGGAMNRSNAASDEATDTAEPAPVAASEEARTPPRQHSPTHRNYHEQEDGAGKWSRAENIVAEKAGGGGSGGFVASSVGRWETPTTQAPSQQQPEPSSAPAPVPSAAAAAAEGEGVFAYTGGGSSSGVSNRVAARPPQSVAPSSAPASSTATTAASSEPGSIYKSAPPSAAGAAPRRIPPSGKASSSADVSALPPPSNANADSRAPAPMRAPSPLRSGGLQVQSLGVEASEMFSAEAVTPTGTSSAELRGGSRTPRSAGASSVAERAAAAEGAGGSGTSVAARVVTWPPASPAPGGRVWQRRTENAISTPSPSLAPAPYPTQAQTSSSLAGTPKTTAAKALAETPPVATSWQRPPEDQQQQQQQREQQQEQADSYSGANGRSSPGGDGPSGGGAGVGGLPGAAVNGGGVSVGVGGGDSGYESALDREEDEDDEDAPPEISGPVKACEFGDCTLEACWGDPRFRPRYCARHKKQGNKLMDPVAAEEGDKEASPEGLSPETSPPPEPTEAPAAASNDPHESPGSPPPFRMMAAAGLPTPSEPEVGNDDVLDGARGRGAAATAAAAAAAAATAATAATAAAAAAEAAAAGGGGGGETETDGLEDDEDEDEGWDSGGGAAVVRAVGGRLVEAPNGGSAMGRTGGSGGGGFSELPKAELVGIGRGNPENDNDVADDVDGEMEDDYHPEATGYGAHGGDAAANAEAEDVQARVAAYGRLSGKTNKVQVPSVPKPRAQKAKKRTSGNNIADFYGGGESDDDNEETAFSMEAYNKGVLLSQAAEVGTHTEDGQLRPQASQERDQQKLAHLMRVGKLGGRISALRGKSVPTASGKRRGLSMWKPSEVVEQSRRRAVVVWSLLMVAITAYTGYLLYLAAEKTKRPDTSVLLTNVVYKYPDLWICPYKQYGCDNQDLEPSCVDSAWATEGGPPDAAFYPKIKLNDSYPNAADELPIEAYPKFTNGDDDDEEIDGRGHCVIFKTSAATAFLGQERDADEYLDYILLDMYWYPGGEERDSTTCVPDGQEWDSHREWVYGFLSDPEDPTTVSTGIQLPYSCITNTSNSHMFNQIGIGLTEQDRYMSDDISSYKAISTTFGIHKDKVDPTISKPYARLSLAIKQQPDSWEIITEADPFEFAEIFGNIGGFWDLLLVLWPIFFVAVGEEQPRLKPRNFTKSVVRGAERAAGITKVVAVLDPRRRTSSVEAGKSASSIEDGLELERRPSWEPPAFERQGSVLSGNSSRVLQRGD
eukprot:g5787.t1